ncbi:nucleoside-diphosphate sugar epimerase [Paenibacillus cremeus]|uniref:Nucleoside-diphosphate sugar epimerase n=1 Tax=Paenibacillus cremeus TaxID=2163881 RepID=A0A559KI90_9BACL|nr:nucleoside-diphosphate sugar epimerase [Paenibacillus cremeus]TVY11842.1 nucleoside-diphosphate sugar epimerase [Paenibacillus cremeus]
MQRQVTKIIEAMAASQWNMAKIIEANRHVTEHIAHMTIEIPHKNPSFGDIELLTDNALSVAKNVAAYLNSLADLEDAIGDNLSLVMKEVNVPDGEE